ncbi:MAG: hypothetical protein MJ058_04075 [Akkermansia sp.]|nr:hypothetical protein [Akkermansia sp.]
MESSIQRIGIIQNAPLPGDFPNNLRALVQGYRDCIDHGAGLVVAPADALCGLEPQDLAERPSFEEQTQRALDALSAELGAAPLILGAYMRFIADDELWDGMLGEDDGERDSLERRRTALVPYLLERDTVTELEDNTVMEIDGLRVYVRLGEGEILPEEDEFDLMVHLGCTPWHATAAADLHDTMRWEATTNGTPVVYCAPVGTAGGNIYGGGSFIVSAQGKPLLRLPFFEPASKVADLETGRPCAALPEPQELLRRALERGIADTVRNNGFTGACVPLDHPNGTLLAALAASALGAQHVCGISFAKDAPAAKALGIAIRQPEAPADENLPAATQARVRAAHCTAAAEELGYMLLCPLARQDIMLGNFTLYAETCGGLAPLGNLYEMDLHLLRGLLREERADLFGALAEPPHPETDRIIHELADRNTPPSELIHNSPLFREEEVRRIQRRIIASALKRTQLPTVLRVDSPAERLQIPATHRLND